MEVSDDPPAMIALAREHGLGAGVAFNPETDVSDAAEAAVGADIVLCMSIHPGYSGQSFLPESLARLRELRSLLPETVYVQVDGGITHDNVRVVHDAGADLIVAGSAIFHREDIPRAYTRLVRALA